MEVDLAAAAYPGTVDASRICRQPFGARRYRPMFCNGSGSSGRYESLDVRRIEDVERGSF
jgi:hypothetical protein